MGSRFTEGQLLFALIFLAAFVLLMFFAYRKDLKSTRGTYKGVYRMFIYIALVLGFYWVILKVIG